ncbi:MAG: helix-turn-helix transcriptional regulator [Clostridia bacterium]|nr:helix-turn-helix transcriptional regulator [Clostridia bacterium]
MKLKLSENIQAMRRARRMTQEQLAEAMGVSIGAVSKWENALSNPDVELIPEIAEFFGTSVDVLLGYGWERRGMGECAERIQSLAKARRDDEACAEAERGLRRYPGSFAVVYQSAKVMMNVGFARGDRRLLSRAKELLERALELIGQNDDVSVSELTIQCDIGQCWVFLGEYEKALEHLRRHNQKQINNRMIGYCLCKLGRIDEAMEASSHAFAEAIAQMLNTSVDVMNCLGQIGENEEALELVDWLIGFGRGLLVEGSGNFVGKLMSTLIGAKGVICADMGREADAARYLREAIREARRHDEAAAHGCAQTIRFYRGKAPTFYDDVGERAMDALRGLMKEQGSEALSRLFERIAEEEGERDETQP